MERFDPTDEQRRVIEHRRSNLLVFAGPGTGKTETLARRFASIVHDDRVEPTAILVLTFSRRATQAMRRRIVQRMRERSGGAIAVPELHVYTFHGFCKRLLDGDAPRGTSRALLTPVKERLIWRRVVERTKLSTFATDVVGSAAFATAALNLIARLKGDGVAPADFRAQAGRDARLLDLAALYEAMDAERTRLGLADFRDLVADAVGALGDRASRASAWLRSRPPFRHVLVDEFQDSDPMQLRLLDVLGGAGAHATPPSPEMCFVGDFNQSIYRFRGAAPENVERARTLFACDELTLRLNRRSVQVVLDVANRTPRLRPESLTSAGGAPADGRTGSVRLMQLETIDREVSAIADAVAERVRAGTKPSDIAVLLRVVEPYRGAIARELEARGIPVAAQATAGFHDDSLVSAVLSAIAVLGGSDDGDRWRRLLTNPLVGFRPLTVSLALGSVEAMADPPRAAFDRLPPRGRRGWADFSARLDACRGAGGAGRRFDPAVLIETIVRELDLLWPIRTAAEVPGFDPSASPARLSTLIRAARDVKDMATAEGERLDGSTFVERFDEVVGLLGDPLQEPRLEAAGVPVMSIHAAKGLEFDMVVLPQLIDGVLPARSRPDALFGSRSSPYVRSADDDLLEESSLFYVALTRARYDVLATAARLGDDSAEQPLSSFAALIDERAEPAATADRIDHEGFAAAYAAADEAERALPQVRRYLDERPVLAAFVRAQALEDEARRALAWPLDRLSASGIEDYVACPRRWFYRYPMRLSADDDDSTRLGRFVHKVLERYHNGATDFTREAAAAPTPERILESLAPIAREEGARAAYESGLATNSPLFRYELARILRQLAAYSRWLVDEAREYPFSVLACERRVEIDVAGTKLVGVVDRVDRASDGTLVVRDYKSGKLRTKASQAASLEIGPRLDPALPGIGLYGDAPEGLKLQTYLYVRAIEKAFGAKVSRADYLYLSGTQKDKAEIHVDTTWFEASGRKGALPGAVLDAVYDVIAAGVAHEVEGGAIAEFATATDEKPCGLCAYKAICPGPATIRYPAASEPAAERAR